MNKVKLLLITAGLMAVSGVALSATTGDESPTSQHPWLDKDVKTFMDEVAAATKTPLYELSYKDARKVLADAQAKPVQKPDVDTQDITLAQGESLGDVKVRITRPKGTESELPVLFYVHGGGWVLGDENTHDRLLREFTAGAKIAVASIIYTPSPEAQYPKPLHQIYAAIQDLIKDADKYKFSKDKYAIAGDSVGGNMATAIAIMSKDKNEPKLGLQVLLYPVTNAKFDDGSYTSFAEGPWLTKKAMEWFWDAYAPDKAKRSEKLASPLQASLEELSGLPETFIITDQNDVLRDEGEAYAQKLIDAGVKVTAVRYNGTTHDFMMLNGLTDTAPTRAAVAQTIDVLKAFYGTK
ncbi:alpha/beta hydrolase [Entomohabitans teleogrylli]|uniref:alpha/beta hydrolase n=1 Tax=Entomohabitans teleogrylli TaxID=1384589 RepID=UPI0008FC9776|nr:alpha/beta hydrolase [Entomohabitans teleogrylli]